MPEPIPCPAAEVEAMLSGRKTMLRRVVEGGVPKAPGMGVHPNHVARHPAPYLDAYCSERKSAANPRGMSTLWCWWARDDRMGREFRVPFKPGDRLSADGRPIAVITAVKVERLQDISEADAIAEGLEVLRQDRETSPPTDFVRNCVSWDQPATATAVGCAHSYRCPIQAFRAMWDATHPPAERWSENPWVAAVAFNPIPANIDTPEAQPSGRVAREESEP